MCWVSGELCGFGGARSGLYFAKCQARVAKSGTEIRNRQSPHGALGRF